MPTRIATLALVVLIATSVRAQSQFQLGLSDEERAWLDENPTIRIGPAPNFPPVEFFDDDGTYRGVASDYARLIEERLGITFEVQRRQTWNGVVDDTQDGQIDVWMEAAETPERSEYMIFSAPYLELPAAIIVRREVRGRLSLDGMSGQRVAVIDEYATEDYLRDNFPDLELVTVPDIQTGLESVSFGSVDAVVANVAAASYYIENRGLTNLRVAGESGFVWELSMASRRDWPILSTLLAKALDDIPDEERREIYRSWVALDTDPAGRLSSRLWFPVFGLVLVLWFVFHYWRSRGRDAVSDRIRWWQGHGTGPIVATAVTAVAGIGIASVWTLSIVQDRARTDVNSSLRTVLNTSSNAIYDWLRERELETSTLARRPEIRRLALDLTDGSAGEGTLSAFHDQLDPFLQVRGYTGFLLLDTNGTPVASSLSDDPERFSDFVPEEFLIRVAASPNRYSVWLPAREGPTPGGDVWTSILVGSTVPDGESDSCCFLVLLVDPGQGFTEILQRGQVGDSGETYAFNRLGQFLSESRFVEDLRRVGLAPQAGSGSAILQTEIRDPGGNLFSGYVPALERGQQPLTRMVQSAIEDGAGADLDGYNNYRGVPVVGAWVWDEDLGMGIASEIEVDEAYAFLAGYRSQTIVSAGFAALLMAGLTALFIQNRVRMAGANLELQEANKVIRSHGDRMEQELRMGREIQMSMVPLMFPPFPDRDEFSIYARLKPAREVGGDFYDFYFLDERHLFLCIGDVSDKGVGAALFMAVAKTVLRTNEVSVRSTAEILMRLNSKLSESNSTCMFVTLFVAILNVDTGKLVYSNGGHNPPLLRRADGTIERLDAMHGPIVGIRPDLEYKESSIRMRPKDLLLLYTDGVTEATNPNGELFSEERLAGVLSNSDSNMCRASVDLVTARVEEFENGVPQSDDVTVLALRFVGPSRKDASVPEVFRIRNVYEDLSIAEAKLDAVARRHGIPPEIARKFKVILDEILKDIISHAYADEAVHQIELWMEALEGRFLMTITDDGRPFNPLNPRRASAGRTIEEREAREGRVHRAQALAAQATYQRQTDQNVLTLIDGY